MQPHTGATLLVINYLVGRIRFVPESFGGRTFDVKSEIFDENGKRLKDKYHLVKTIRCNPKSRELDFEVGKDWACYLKVRYDYNFENIEFLQHRHSKAREKFYLRRDSHLKASSTFSGEYSSDNDIDHSIKGTAVSDKNFIFKDTYLEYKGAGNKITRKYNMKII